MKIVFISDIHSNLEALQAVMEEIKKISPREVFCLGDLCGYGADPTAVINSLKSMPCLMGNHDFATVVGDTSWFNPYAAEAIEWTRSRLSSEELTFLSNLKHRFLIKSYGLKIYMVHGSPEDPLYGYVYEEDADVVKNLDCDVLVLGHTHIPFVKKVGEKLVINAGSVGQPRDRDPRSSFAVLETESIKPEIVRVEYDVATAARKIVEAGLPKILAERLHEGM